MLSLFEISSVNPTYRPDGTKADILDKFHQMKDTLKLPKGQFPLRKRSIGSDRTFFHSYTIKKLKIL